MGFSVVQQRTNFVSQVAMQANISLGNTVGTLTKPGSIAEYANNAAGNFGKIAEIGMHAASMAENNQPSQDASGPSGASSGMKSMIGAAAMIGIGAALPVMAPLAAAVGVALAAKDAVNFSLGHAAVDGAKGELTMAAAAATFDKDNNMTSYTAACDNSTTDVKSGKSLAAMTVGPSGGAAQVRGQHQLGAVIGDVASQYDPEQIQRDVKAMLDKEKKNFGWAINKLDMMGVLDPNSDKTLELSNEAKVALKIDTPRPKALNVGMGAPGMA